MSAAGREEKKRRHTNTKMDSGSVLIEVKTARDKLSADRERSKTTDLQQKAKQVYAAEDELVSRRDAKADITLFKSACEHICKMMNDIHKLKTSKNLKEDAVRNKRIDCSLHFLTLRKLNRLAHLRCKKVRESTTECKRKTDQYHLQLQNLFYEVSHQEKEITKCLEFKSKDEEIKLVDLETFYEEATSVIEKSDLTKSDPHQLTLCRLNWELEQRKRLAEKLEETESLKELVNKDIDTHKRQLDDLSPKLEAILESTKPVQEYLNMPFDALREQQRTARYLPAPLYVLYVQATGYKDTCDKKITIDIEGDIEEAARTNEFQISQPEVVSEEEEDGEDEGRGEEGTKRKTHRRHTSHAEIVAQRKRQLLQAHPLRIVIGLTYKDNLSLRLVFSYISKLQIVTLSPELGDNSQLVNDDLLSPRMLLQCLYLGDNGLTSPNSANQFQLDKCGLNYERDCVEKVGLSYHWVQWLAGLHFSSPDVDKVGRDATGLSGCIMDSVMKKIEKRVSTRLQLQKQMSHIAKGVVNVDAEFMNRYPAKINSNILSWERESFDNYMIPSHCGSLANDGLVQKTDLIYVAKIGSGSAGLTAHIAISPAYPEQAPLFALSLTWFGERTRYNDENIMAMEREVNYYIEDMSRSRPNARLLSNQIQRLRMCLDVYLEVAASQAESASPREFPQEKIMPRMNRGPQRSMPFQYVDQLSLFMQR